MKKNKKTKKILAIIALAFGGPLAATSILSPFIFKNWKQIQYDIIELKQNDKLSSDDSVNFDFSFNDAQTGELNGKDIKVSLYEVDAQGKRKSTTAAQTGLAKFNQLYRKWVYTGSELEQKLLAGTKYEIVFSSASSGITKENVQFNTSSLTNNYVITKANVSAFEFKSIDSTTQEIVVTFGDNQKTLENKKAILKYFYTSTTNDKDFRNDESRSRQEVEIKDGKAVFTLSGLQPSRKYTIEYVAVLEETNNGLQPTKEIEVAYAKSIDPSAIEGGSTFKTNDVKLTASSFETSQVKENTADILIGFKKNTGEADFSLTGKEATLVYRRKGSSEQKEINARVIGDVVNFRFNGADEKSTLQEGSFFIVDAVKVQDSQVEWKSELADESTRTFQTAVAVSKIEFGNILEKSAVLNLEITSQDNKDNIADKVVQVSFEPLLSKVPAETRLKLKAGTTDTYEASINLEGLSQGQEYKLDRVKLKLDNKDQNIDYSLKYRGDEGEKLRSFATPIQAGQLALQGAIVTEHSSAKLTLVFSPEYSFLNGQIVTLKYKKLNPASDEVFEVSAEAKANSLVYDLSEQVETKADGTKVTKVFPLQPGSQYELVDAYIKTRPELNFEITTPQGKKEEKQFATKSTIKSITTPTVTDTTATVVIAFEDNLNTLPKVDATTARKAKIVYRPLNAQIPPISTTLVALADNNTVTFELSGLLKGFTYEIESIQFDHALSTFYSGNISTLPNHQNQFTTSATQFELKSVSYSDQKETSAKGAISFDLTKDLVLVQKTINVYYKDLIDANAAEQKLENITIDDLGVASIDFANLLEGKKYQITRVESTDASLGYNFSIPTSLESQNHFYTKAAVSSIETPAADITENSAKIHLNITNANPTLITADSAVFKVSYSDADGISGSMEKTITKAEFDSKMITIDLTNLAKDTTYTIDKLYLNGEEIKRTTTFVDDQNTFKTPAQSIKVLGLNRIDNSDTTIDFEFNFDSVVDAYANGKQLKVSIQKDNSIDAPKEFLATVENGIVSFKATDLEPGSSYTVKNLEFTDAEISAKTHIVWSDDLVENKRDIYTSEIVKLLEFPDADLHENTAKVVITFSDPQNKFNGKHVFISLLDDKGNILDFDSKNTNENSVITDKTFTIDLTGLSKFTTYTITDIKVDLQDNNYQEINISDQINKSFKTKATSIEIASVVVEDITTNSAKAIYTFKDEDDYLESKEFTIILSALNAEEISKTATITKKAGVLVAEFALTDLLEGKKYSISNASIEGIEQITGDDAKFDTLPVVKAIKVSNVYEQKAIIVVEFQNENETKTLNGKQATIKFLNGTAGSIVTQTSRINGNVATFTLRDLSKVTKYDFQDITVAFDQSNEEIPLDHLFTDENQQDRAKNFTTTSSTATVLSIIDDKSHKSINSSRLIFQFDRLIDGFMGGKQLTLAYRNKQDGSAQQLSQPATVDPETNAVTFDVEGLEEGGAYVIEALNSNDNIAIKFADTLEDTDKQFATNPVVSAITYNVPTNEDSDTKIGLTLTFDDRLASLDGKNVSLFITSLTSGSQRQQVSTERIANNSISFQLENLEKKNEFLIEDVLVDGVSINFKSSISSVDSAQRKFTTTAKRATVKTVSVLETTKNSSTILISFDPAKDWFVIGKKVKLFFRKGDENFQTKEFLIDSEGNINTTIVAETLENDKSLSSGSSYEITDIQIQENTDQTVVNSDVKVEGKPEVLGTFNTSSTINSISYANQTESSIKITIGLQTEDTSLRNRTSYVQVINNINNTIKFAKSMGFDDQNRAVYQLDGIEKDNTFTVLGISLDKQDGTLLEFTKDVKEQDKNFRTTPTSATVTNITYKFLDPNQRKILVRFEFDSAVDSFLNGKALKVRYKKTNTPTTALNDGVDVFKLFNEATQKGEYIKVKGSSIEFTLQGRVDQEGRIVNLGYGASGEYARLLSGYRGWDTQGATDNARNDKFKGLLLASNYIIESLKVLDIDANTNAATDNTNITINIPNNLNKTFKTDSGVGDYHIDRITEKEDGVETEFIGSYNSNEDLTAMVKSDIKIRFYNITTGKYTEYEAKDVKKDSSSGITIEGLYKVRFIFLLEKQSRYQIQDTLIKGVPVKPLQNYYGGVGGDRPDREGFSVEGNISTVNEIKLNQFTKTTADLTIAFVSANENLLRTNAEVTVFYKKLNENGAETGNEMSSGATRFNENTKKIEVSLSNLQEGTKYRVTRVRVSGGRGTFDNIPVRREENAVIKSEVHKDFYTKSVIKQIVTTAITQDSATLNVALEGETTYLNNEPATVTLVKLDAQGQPTSQTYTFTTASNANYDSTRKQATFNVTNLEKLTAYRVESIAIGLDAFDWKQNTPDSGKSFVTSATNATVTNVDFSDIVDQTATIHATFSANDGFMAGRSVAVVYKEIDEQGRETGNEITSSAATVPADLKVNFNLTNLNTNSKYRVIRFEDQAQQSKPTIHITPTSLDFNSYNHIDSITYTSEEQSATVTVLFKDRLLDRIKGKIVSLQLGNYQTNYYSSINDQGQAVFVIRGLAKETTYTISHIMLNNREAVYKTGFTDSSKQFKTKGTTATITSITKGNATTSTAEVTLTFADIDKYLLNKSAKLKYKIQGESDIKTSLTGVNISQVSNSDKTTVTFNLNNQDVESGKRYEITGLEVNNAENTAITFNFSTTIETSTPEVKLFETKVAQPTIKSAEIVETKNDEGLDNTYLSKVNIVFTDPTDSLDLNLLNNWSFQIKNNNSGSKEVVQDVEFINRSFIRQGNETTVTVYIKGDAEKWAVVDNDLEVKFKYFDNLEKTNSVDTPDFVGTKENGSELLTIRTVEQYLVREIKGYIASGYDMQFNLRVYDPKDLIQTEGTKPANQTSNALRSGSNMTSTSAVYFATRSKKSIINLKGEAYTYNSNSSYNYTNWTAGNYTDGAPNDNIFADGSSTKAANVQLSRWKFSTQGQNWQEFDSVSNKTIQYVQKNNKYKEIGININTVKGGSTGNILISKILNLNLETLRIKDHKPLIALKSATIWSNYQTPNLIGSGTNFAGSLNSYFSQSTYVSVSTDSAEQKFVKSRWAFGASPFLDNENTSNRDVGGNINFPNKSLEENIAIENVNYNEQTGKLDFIIHLPKTSPDPNNPSSRRFHEKSESSQIFALLVNDNGDIYLVGNSNGNGLDFVNDIKLNSDVTQGTLSFDFKSPSIPEDQRPKEGEKLRVAALVTTFTSSGVNDRELRSNLYTIMPNNFLFPFNWRKFDDAYKEIVYKK